MYLSLQSRQRRKIDWVKRANLIKNEKLHIGDDITQQQFLELFKKYGEGFSDQEFAKYFLDIPTMKCYYLWCGKIKTTPILTLEYVSPQKIEEIRNKVKNYLTTNNMKELTKSELLYLHEKFGEVLELKEFAEEAMGISQHAVECMNCEGKETVKVYRNPIVDRKYIREFQERVARENNLHIGDELKIEEIEEIYKKYKDEIDERTFAVKILQISNGRYNLIKREKPKDGKTESKKLSSIFTRYVVDPDYIEALREKVILQENLHINDPIDNERFKELHKKYGGILSEVMFAEEILDVSAVGVKNMRVSHTNSLILTDIEVPEEYIQELCQKIIDENGLEQNQLINKEEFQVLYDKYAYVLSKEQFATLVLDISLDSFNSVKYENNQRMRILRNYKTTDFEELKKRIIKEEHLHFEDTIRYKKFKELYLKYSSPNVKESVFAQKVLDIKISDFNNMKYSKSKIKILRNEKLPSEEEFEKLKWRIIRENKLHIKDTMNIETFNEYHLKYGGIIPAEMFAEKIFDLSVQTLKKMKADTEFEAQILLKESMSDEEIKLLRQKIIYENCLYIGKEISLEEFNNLYDNYEHILQQIVFGTQILGVGDQSVNKLKSGNCETVKLFASENKKERREQRKRPLTDDQISQIKLCLIEGLTEEEIASRLFIEIPYLRKNLKKEFSKNGRISKQEIQKERIRYLYLFGYGLADIKKLVAGVPEEIKSLLEEVKQEEKQKDRDAKMIQKEKQKKEREKAKQEAKKSRAKELEKQDKNARKRKVAQKKDEKSQQDLEYLEKRVKKILDDYVETPKRLESVKEYIELCGRMIEDKSLTLKRLELLGESIIFLQSGEREISLYAKGCILFGNYKNAVKFINQNIQNEAVSVQGKKDLENLRQNLRYAMKKQDAVNLVFRGEIDPKIIAYETGISEVEAMSIIKRMKNNPKREIEFE